MCGGVRSNFGARALRGMKKFGARALWLVSTTAIAVAVGCGDAQQIDDATGGAGGARAGGGGAGPGVSAGGVSSAAGASNCSASGGSALGGAPPGGASGGAEFGGAAPSGGAPTSGNAGARGAIGGAAGAPAASNGAPEFSPTGYGQATTGGGKAKAIVVTSLAAMKAAVDAYSGAGGLVLQYAGKFDFATIKDPCVQHTLPAQTLEIKNKSDVSIVGEDGSAANFGIRVVGDSRNVIIRNMTIGLAPGADASDLISIEGGSAGFPSNVWVDHNELFTSMAECAGAGDTAFDGMIDVKKGADNVTVSYNYMHDHHKMSLNGYSDDDSAVRHITFHHNLFENVGSRTPLQRHGYSHLLNNYFLKVLTSGINVRMGGFSLVEANYFEDVKNPVTSRDSSAVGFWDLRSNNLAGIADVTDGNAFKITWDSGNSGTVNATAWKTTAAFPVALGYTYHADSFECVHLGLRAVVGAGKGLATLKCQ